MKNKNKKEIDYTKSFLIVLTFMFLLNAGTIYMYNSILQDQSLLVSNYYNNKANKNIDEDITRVVGDYCMVYKTNLSRVKCVNDFVVETGVYNYTSTPFVVLSDQLMETGGDCKSWTTFYKGVFNYMGIHSNLIYSTNHVYLNVFDDTFYCNVDQESIDCNKFN